MPLAERLVEHDDGLRRGEGWAQAAAGYRAPGWQAASRQQLGSKSAHFAMRRAGRAHIAMRRAGRGMRWQGRAAGPCLYCQEVPVQPVPRGVEIRGPGRLSKHALLAAGARGMEHGCSAQGRPRAAAAVGACRASTLCSHQPTAAASVICCALLATGRRAGWRQPHSMCHCWWHARCQTGRLEAPHLMCHGGQASASKSSNQCLSNW